MATGGLLHDSTRSMNQRDFPLPCLAPKERKDRETDGGRKGRERGRGGGGGQSKNPWLRVLDRKAGGGGGGGVVRVDSKGWAGG